MNASGLRVRFLAFRGPARQPASISFEAGLNVIYGASNTGKSFIVDTIDFMLGGRGPLRDIPERVGYDRVLLGMETHNGQQFTIERSANGGAFKVFEGLFTEGEPQGPGKELADQHSDRRDDNLSTFLLSKINLSKKKLRKNRAGATQSLSFRNLARLVIVNEQEIIQQRSPLNGIEEAGTLFSAFGDGTCPLCGAAPEHHRLMEDCDGNIELVVAAAKAEANKIQVRQPDQSLLGIVLSHGHRDHWGLIPIVQPDIPLVMGKAVESIMRAAAPFMPDGFAPKVWKYLKDKKPLQIGPFTVTPHLVDHSGFDAYALEIEAGGFRLFYSGDFRAHEVPVSADDERQRQ